MRVLQIGSSGTVGSAVLPALRERGHDVVVADWHGDRTRAADSLPVDITDPDSIASVYAAAGEVDAVVNTVGQLALAPLDELTGQHVAESVAGKLTSQVHLVLAGLPYLRPGGSFTLVSGIMSRIPWRGGVTAAITNGGIDAFVVAVAAELTGDRRINAVSPSIVQESIDRLGGTNPLPGHAPVTAAQVALAYLRSVEGIETGHTFTVGF